ncbi:hypothetical protein CCR75_006445 [Bremia lactucae]|uniref:RWP-RK domain-containing protein n=1 Tax=Bremia lactucae TaxID=4779 RepID=A0A976FNF4_BRELC|nr:hypothetical protein CCR75_006445 [Bremia lactucae]
MSSATPTHSNGPSFSAVNRALWTHQLAVGRSGLSGESDQKKAMINASSENGCKREEPGVTENEDMSGFRRQRQRIHFNVEQLQTVYHLPLKTAAGRLGICEAALKRICRRNCISKWPYRQLSSVRRRIAEIKDRRALMLAGSQACCCDPQLSLLVTPAQIDEKLQQLEREHDQIIHCAHQPRRSTATNARPGVCPSDMQLSQEQLHSQPGSGEALTAYLHGGRGERVLRIDQDSSLLFLANVCESIRAYK